MEVNSNDMDNHAIKTMYRSYPCQTLMSIMINMNQKESLKCGETVKGYWAVLFYKQCSTVG